MSHPLAERPALSGTGIGLRAPHVTELLGTLPPVGWLEIHAENYMGGGSALLDIERLRARYPISLHGVGLSLGSAEGLDKRHLARLQRLAARIEPALVSEHLSWSTSGGAYLNDLLPLPYTEEALAVVCRHVDEAQATLKRPLLIENPSSYMAYAASAISEPQFLTEMVRRTGCGLLCDVNNIHVSAHNLDFDADAYIDALPAAAVGEIHLAGHHRTEADGQVLLIDDHGSEVAGPVWRLYGRALRRFGRVPALVEWDSQLPDLATLLGQAQAADHVEFAVIGERAL